MKIIKFFSILLFLFLQQISHLEANDFKKWVDDFKKRALDQNISLKTVNRVALHAHSLEILHPTTKKKMLFKAELPQDLQQALEILKNG